MREIVFYGTLWYLVFECAVSGFGREIAFLNGGSILLAQLCICMRSYLTPLSARKAKGETFGARRRFDTRQCKSKIEICHRNCVTHFFKNGHNACGLADLSVYALMDRSCTEHSI